jgi:hypothetical protein
MGEETMENLHGHEDLNRTKLRNAYLQKGICFNLNANLTLFVNALAVPTSALLCLAFFRNHAIQVGNSRNSQSYPNRITAG